MSRSHRPGFRRPRGRWLAMVLGLVPVLACGTSGSGGDGDAITLQLTGEAEELAVYEQLVTAAERSLDDIDAELVGIARKDDHITRLVSGFTAGSPPEVFLVNFREYASFVANGGIEPIGLHLDLDLGAYYEAPLEAFTLDGVLQCFPQNVSSLVVYYNVDLFEAAGLDHPDSWTWEEFREVGEQLTTGAVRGIGLEPSVIRLAPFVWGNEGELTDDPDDPSRFTLADGPAREALEWFVGLARDGLTPTREELVAEELENQFIRGRVATLLSSRRATPVLREVRGLRWDVAPLPEGAVPAGILHSDAYCMASDLDPMVRARAVELIEFAVGPRGQTVTALGGRTVPSSVSVAEGPFLDPGQPPEHAEVFLDAVQTLRRTPVITTWPEIEDRTDEILERLFFEEGYTIDEGVADLRAATDPLFAEARSG